MKPVSNARTGRGWRHSHDPVGKISTRSFPSFLKTAPPLGAPTRRTTPTRLLSPSMQLTLFSTFTFRSRPICLWTRQQTTLSHIQQKVPVSHIPQHSTFQVHTATKIFQLHHLSSHLSLNHEGLWGTTDDFATGFVHFSLFSTALWDLPNSRPVHSLRLSSHLFLCLSCLLPPFTVPCRTVLARPDEWET